MKIDDHKKAQELHQKTLESARSQADAIDRGEGVEAAVKACEAASSAQLAHSMRCKEQYGDRWWTEFI